MLERISGQTRREVKKQKEYETAINEKTAEQIYELWDEALAARDEEGAVPLYARDVVLESPLVRHLTGSAEGVVRGRENLRDFVRLVFARTPPTRRRYRTSFFTDGRTIMWEYPREAPDATRWISSKSWRSRTASSAAIASIGAGSA